MLIINIQIRLFFGLLLIYLKALINSIRFFCLLKSSTFGTRKNIIIFHDPFSKTISYKKNVIWKIVDLTGHDIKHHNQAYINLEKQTVIGLLQ